MIKLQQYYIFKFETDRLKEYDYDININIRQARKNGELVSIGDSQMLRSLRKIRGREDDEKEIKSLLSMKAKYKKRNSISDVRLSLFNIETELDKFLFVPEIISIVVNNVKHYEYIVKNGLFVNNKKFVRLMCSAGQARRNSVLMIDSDYEQELKRILNNDREDIEITPAKFNAYFALASSTALPVTYPYFCVIPDCEIFRTERVEFITEREHDDDLIEEKEVELPFNLFDGMGIISPRMAEGWAKDLDLDYIPSSFVIRSNFIKGLVTVIDFVKFSDEIGKHIINDIYGNKVNIRDMDVIITESQFKLYQAFNSTKDYVENSKKNGWGWGVTRYAPKQENSHTFLNYQFLQALDLNDEQIESICSMTLDYFNNVLKNNFNYTLLYLLGKNANKDYDKRILDKVSDNVTKSLIMNNELIKDPYIQNYIIRTLNKKIKESYIGNLIVEGFYTFVISDPYAFMEHMFGLEVKGLLGIDEHYNKHWIKRGVNKISAMRSPLTWRSEVDVLNLKENDMIRKWFKYINNGMIFNVHGCDMAILGGCDMDGDLVCLTNQKEVADGAYGGLPIFYETKPAPKQKIKEDELYLADLKGFNTKVGFLTNCSTTMYSMLPMFTEDSKEHKELIRRLKQCRKEQGAIIDATKGLIIKPIPPHWTNWTKIEDGMTEEEIERANFNNSILVEKRPLFMQHLYANYNKKYRQHRYNYDLYSIANFGKELDALLQEQIVSKEEQCFLEKYYKYNPLLETNCVVNKISNYMQDRIKEIKRSSNSKNTKEVVKILKDPEFNVEKDKLDKLYAIYKKYKGGKRNFGNLKDENGEARYKTIEQYNKSIKDEALSISSDICELASLAVVITYELHPNDNKAFCWGVFGEGIVENVRRNRQKKLQVPFLHKNGDISYMGNKYLLMDVELEEFYDFL